MEYSDPSFPNSSYYAYMLRFWPERHPGETTWRFTLLDPHSGKCLGFHSLEALTNHLASLTQDNKQSE